MDVGGGEVHKIIGAPVKTVIIKITLGFIWERKKGSI